MTPVKVYTPLPAGIAQADLTALLTSAGLSGSSVDEWVAHCPNGDGQGVLLVIASDDAATADGLENAVREAISRGERVIAVWPLGTESSTVAPVLQDYGAGLVIWDPTALHAAICGPAVEWRDAGGGVRPVRPLERNNNC